MVPFGAGSSVEGNFSSPYSGICIDFVHMDQIVAFHPEDMDVVVQPGVNWMDLNKEIAHAGLFVPLDPSPTAMIGGMVSTNCSGTNAMRYGTMKDWVLNLTVVLADGSVIKTRKRPRKTSAGYNLTTFFVGAEGTLGIVTEVTLKLAPIPQDTSVAVVSFPSIRDAASAASDIMRSGIQLAALELMDDLQVSNRSCSIAARLTHLQMQVLNKHGSAAVRKRRWDEDPTLFLKSVPSLSLSTTGLQCHRFSGTTDAIQSDIKRVSQLIKTHNAGKFHFAKTKQDELDLWAGRKESLFTMVATKPENTILWSTDVAVPLSRLAEIIGQFHSIPISCCYLPKLPDLSKSDSDKLGIFASVVGHVGDGNFHLAMFYNPDDPEQKAAVGKVVHDMTDRALEMDGTVSGEHAIGIGKKVRLTLRSMLSG